MPTGRSLHIGLNSVDPHAYSGWSGPLIACENDAASMSSICAQAGFQPRTLLTAAATRAAVLNELQQAAALMAAGDTLVISYSGHGGQLPDLNGDESDSLDETWCLYDGQLLDDELQACWARFPAGARIVVFSDSCHSGTVIKMLLMNGRLRSMGLTPEAADAVSAARTVDPLLLNKVYFEHRAFYDGLLRKPAPPPEPACSVILVSGCQDNQLSMDGPFNGAFTGVLMAVWANGAFRGSYKELTAAVRKRLPPSQSPQYMVTGVRDGRFISGQALSIQG
ncbi:caspase family protein [Caulobacter sp.]|uniref:caspase family protein n=1 Tax=Caulobacter sp. TaxID=78 RepID=UPI003BA9B1AB